MKKGMLMILSVLLLCLEIVTCHAGAITAKADGTSAVTRMKEKAVDWVLMQQNPDGSFGDNRMVVDTAEVMKVLRREGKTAGTEWMEGQKETILQSGNQDSLSRYVCAVGEWELMEHLAEGKNEDGGYGLTAKYRSDILDSMLVWSACAEEGMETGTLRAEAGELLSYFQKEQKEDGGFAYPGEEKGDTYLTGEISIGLALCERYRLDLSVEELTEKAECYINVADSNPEQPETFAAWAYGEIYRSLKDRKRDSREAEIILQNLQAEDGSFHGTMEHTLLAIRLLQVMEENNKPYLHVEEMDTELSSYTLYTGKETKIQVTSRIWYETNTEKGGVWRITGYTDGEETFRKERDVAFTSEETEYIVEETIKMTGAEETSQSIKMELFVDGAAVLTKEEILHSRELVIGELTAEGRQSGREEVALWWNDLSNDYCRYGYRVYRQVEEGAWESRSTWNGEETVKVLNIYPCEQVNGLIESWMEEPLSKEGYPAGRGLFTIDNVSMDAYNQSPETYLKDENGAYRYDVLVFGIYNQNAGRDLSEKGYEATQAFVDAGRGVLFGHDTVTLHGPAYHVNFSRFAEQLGCKVVTGGGWYQTNYAKVIRDGYVTSYPWKIAGRLTIPLTHSTMQFTGGSLDATVWMELEGDYYTDHETGGKTNAYLFTKNQLAMIQTGDNVDMPTDDERKVLANTLFYLKQLSSDTRITDQGAYDLEAPGESKITEIGQGEDTVTLHMEAEDNGTTYRYYVEAVPQGIQDETLGRTSEIVETESVSGIRGFVVWMEGGEEVFVPATEGVAETTLSFPEGETACTVSVKAVDKNGMEGAVTSREIEKEKQNDFTGTGAIYAADDLTIGTATMDVSGNVEAGGAMTLNGSLIQISGNCLVGGTLQAYVGELQTGERREGVEVTPKENVFDEALFATGGCTMTEALRAYNSHIIEAPTYSESVAELYGTTMYINTRLLTEEDIRISASEVILNGDILSKNGDIHIHASDVAGKGTIRAPKGSVYLYVSRLDLQGGIFAENVTIQASDVKIICGP